MLTRNFKKLQAQVQRQVERRKQGNYKICFIFCLAGGVDNPAHIEREYGIPLMVSKISESIFEALPKDEAPEFFAALPSAIETDGKDLSRVGPQFLAAELRSLPPVPTDVQAAIDPVIAGMDLLSEGKEWPSEAAWAAAWAAWAAHLAARSFADPRVRRRQRDTLLQLIKEAPVTQEATHD